MPVSLYMDVNVHGQITVQLRRRGVDVLTAQEDNMRTADDVAILDRATALRRVLVSADKDFLAEAVVRQRRQIPFPGLFHISGKSLTVGQLIADMELLVSAGTPEDFVNQIYFLPL